MGGEMKRVRYIVIVVLGLSILVSCSSTPSVTLNNQSWLGTATRQENPDTFVRVTFRQEGKNVAGTLELGETEDTLVPDSELTGSLEGRSLELNNLANDTLIFGTFDEEAETFSGTLRFVEEDSNVDFALTLVYQQETPSSFRNDLLESFPKPFKLY
jgi:hypothetical protein